MCNCLSHFFQGSDNWLFIIIVKVKLWFAYIIFPFCYSIYINTLYQRSSTMVCYTKLQEELGCDPEYWQDGHDSGIFDSLLII